MSDSTLTEHPPSPEDEMPWSPATPEEEDDGLILWMLSLTPTQRLEVAQNFVDSVVTLRNGRRS